jgi:hypothetical protein
MTDRREIEEDRSVRFAGRVMAITVQRGDAWPGNMPGIGGRLSVQDPEQANNSRLVRGDRIQVTDSPYR